MKSIRTLRVLSSAALAVLGVRGASAATITQWNFAGATTGTLTTGPAPSTGAGTSASLGMTNSYTYANGEGPGASDGSNFASVKSAAVTTFSETTWKIVGNSNKANAGAGMANGWNNAAPNYTQGAQFAANTAGYSNLGLSFDWYCTTQGVGNLQVRYTTDVTQGANTVWVNAGPDLVATPNDFYGATAAGVPQPSVSLSIPGVSNDPNFAVEMVSVRPAVGDSNFSATGPGSDGNYASAAGGGADYNNSSGNWSFDNITITGNATPEPGSLGLAGLAGLALLGRRRDRKA